jgi:hypothetical protein
MTHVHGSRELGITGENGVKVNVKYEVKYENRNITPLLRLVVLNDSIFFIA